MPRHSPSLRFYIVVSSVYAAAVYVAVRVLYELRTGQPGQPEGLPGPVETIGVALWLGLSVIGAVLLHRLVVTLEALREASRQQEAGIGSVFALTSALSGSLELEAIGGRFLEAARQGLDATTTAGLLVYDDTLEVFRVVAESGPRAGSFAGRTYSASTLPAIIRTRVIDHRQSLLIADTATSGQQWQGLSEALPEVAWARSFGALPLISDDRLVGVLLLGAETPRALAADRVQLPVLLGHLVAGSIRTALTVREAEARANREAVISRVAQRARASLDPEQVLRATVEELGRALNASRVVAATGATAEELRVAAEWTAASVAPLGLGSRRLAVARRAVRTNRTVIVGDVRGDTRLAEQPADLEAADVRAAIATPIVLAAGLAGTLTLHQVDRPRAWTSDEVRLVEGVARELRVAMELARLFEARQRENERLLALQRASSALAAHTGTHEVLSEILKSALGLLGHGSASLYTWDDEAQLMRLALSVDPYAHPVSASVAPGEGLAGRAFSTLARVIVNDYANWEGAMDAERATGLRAALAVPLVRSGRVLGAIVVHAYHEGASFAEDDAQLLSLIGDQAAAALTTVAAFERQRRAVEQLERLNRAKSDFVSVVSHEFRTPLTGIQGFSEMMRDEDLTPEEVREYASDINKDAMRLNRMINDMLDLDRIESGRMPLHRESVELNALVADVVGRARPNAPSHTLTLQLGADVRSVDADRDRLVQVVSNLVSNAVKYSPTGGEIVLTTRIEGGLVHLLVRDRGIGIPADALETIFERYSRVDSQATRAIKGTGLGLPIVRQIVEMHGGKVWAESELGQGSIFHVLLPVGPLAPKRVRVEA